MKLEPMLASDLKDHPSANVWRATWVMEIKYDGCRMMWHDGHLYGRSGESLWSSRYSWLDRLTEVMPKGTVLDGELWVPGGTVADVLSTAAQDKVGYVIFDILQMARHEVWGLPWRERREILEMLIPAFSEMAGRVAISAVMEPVKNVAMELMRQGHEGVMLKQQDSAYLAGTRSNFWLKYKATQDADVVIVDCDSPPTRGSYGDHHDWGVLSYGFFRDGVLVRCGSVGHSAPKEHQQQFIGKVAVIKHNGVYSSGALRHPRILRYRDDKLPQDCTFPEERR